MRRQASYLKLKSFPRRHTHVEFIPPARSHGLAVYRDPAQPPCDGDRIQAVLCKGLIEFPL